MSPNRHFHLFLDLPVELQLLIWGFFMESEPTVRHEFTNLSHKDGSESDQWYFSSDEESGKYIDRTINPEGVVTGTVYDKLNLLDTNMLQPPYIRFRSWNHITIAYPATTQATRDSILVNFERDIFSFNCRQALTLHKGDGTLKGPSSVGSWFALTHPMSYLEQFPDWIFNVRKLALLRPSLEDDYQFLTNMTRLKTLYVVVEQARKPNARPAPRLFTEIEARRELEIRIEVPGKPVTSEDSQKIHDKFVNLFTKWDMDVEVKIEVDTDLAIYETEMVN